MANHEIPFNLIFVIIVALFFLLGFCSVFIRQTTDTSSTNPINNPNIPSRSCGLDPELIQTFPTFLYSQVKHLKIGKNALECAVCLNEFEDSETLRLLPKCDHVFHPDCIDMWLGSHTSCPVCRANLSEPDSVDKPLSESTESVTDTGSVTIHVVNDETLDDESDKSTVSSVVCSKFPRSHSTGHSLVRPGEDIDRFTLRLPNQIREEIMTQATNRVAHESGLPRVTSERRGYRESYRRFGSLDRPNRWMFSMGISNQNGSGSEGSERRFDWIGKMSFKRVGGSKRSEPGLLRSV